MKISKRWLLVVLVNLGQLGCLLLGLAWYVGWLDGTLSELLRQDILANNRHLARQMAGMIEEMGIRDLGSGSADWERVQTLIERTRLPNEGFLCIVENGQGRLICHPELRRDPRLATMKPGAALLHGPGLEQRIIASTPKGTTLASGWAQMPDGTHLIAVSDLPDLGVKVLAHQRERGLRAKVRPVTGMVGTVGTAAAVLLAVFSGLLTTLIVRSYENRLARANANLENFNEELERLAERRSRALLKMRDAVIFGLAKLAESRGDQTGRHLERIRGYVQVLAEELARKYPEIDDETVQMLGLTSSLHDIGKVGIPDAILLKRGPLTPGERAVMQKHPLIGGDCLLAIKGRLGEDDFLEIACEIALGHHERWDGRGHPFGLQGNGIALSARIVALADVYDALTTKRVYKEALPHEQARKMIIAEAGAHFDPEVVEAFLAREDDFRASC